MGVGVCERIVSREGEAAGLARSRHVQVAGSRGGEEIRERADGPISGEGRGREVVLGRRSREKARLVDGLDEGAARAAAGIAARLDGALVDAVLGRGAGTTLPEAREQKVRSGGSISYIYTSQRHMLMSVALCYSFPHHLAKNAGRAAVEAAAATKAAAEAGLLHGGAPDA